MTHSLRKLAKLCGVSTSYRDMNGKIVKAKAETVKKLLQAILGKEVSSAAQIKSALASVEDEIASRIAAPVVVAWDGKLASLFVTVTKNEESLVIASATKQSRLSVAPIHGLRRYTRNDGRIRARVSLKLTLPFGYHNMTLTVGASSQQILVISAPLSLAPKNRSRTVGLFAPVYALRSANNSGIGDLNDLATLCAWFSKLGGDFIATLPLLASDYSKTPIDPSPYSSISRLFLNEIYIPVLGSKGAAKLQHSDFVDYDAVYKEKKKALLAQSDGFFKTAKNKNFERFVAEVPEVVPYARYRSKSKREQNFHLYCQFKMHEKLKAVGSKLMLDLPVGVASKSFDVEHYPDSFLKGTSAGAPPDSMFRSGQNWGFYPMHPRATRANGYAYFARSLQRQFSYARRLRIDHAAGLHRIFTIPDKSNSKDGTYIRFHSDELYAVLLLEAHRAKAAVVGEDLGVVPDVVREKMAKHGISGMWVYEFAMTKAPKKALSDIPANSLRLLDTHDLPPLFAFAQSLGSAVLKKWSHFLLKKKEHPYIDNDFVAALLKIITAPKGSLNQINLEDLWLENEPQNIPGTTSEYPNWKKKHRYTMEEFMISAPIKALLRSLTRE